jgi:hypothetical protein
MILAIISLIIFLALVWLLFLPIEIYINTKSNEYYGELKGLAKASIETDEFELIRIKVKIPFKEFYYFPLKTWWTSKGKGKEKKAKKKSNIAKRFTPKTMLRLIRSFKIKTWNIDLDTGDCITNAKLYPLFSLMDYRFGGFRINFEGRNHVLLQLRNRPIYVLKSFINS